MPQLLKKVVEGHFLMHFGAFCNNVQQLTLQENRQKFEKKTGLQIPVKVVANKMTRKIAKCDI